MVNSNRQVVWCLLAIGAICFTRQAIAEVLVGPVIFPDNGHTYYFLDHATWTESQIEATELGGNLATLNDLEEENFILSFRGPGFLEFWIGLSDAGSEGVYQWASGEPLEYVRWRDGEPNGGVFENYVHTWPDGSGWNDVANDYPFAFGVVEVVPEPTTGLLLAALSGFVVFRRR